MCLAIPGKVIKLEGRQAFIEYPGQIRPALVGNETVKVGDFVMVQMGIIIKILDPEEATSALTAWQE